MKKLIIIGSPGSGKSTLARALHRITKLPLHHLDMMYWNADKTTVPKEIFRARLKDALSDDSFIIDGNYGSTMEMRMEACDTVIFLDFPTEVCLEGIRERRGKPRSDMPWVETVEDEEFISFVTDYNKNSRPRVYELLEKHANKRVIILKNREEVNAFVAQTEKSYTSNEPVCIDSHG